MRRRALHGGASRGKVLVVDDEGMILEILSILLEEAGFAVATTQSAVGLPEIVRSEVPDVVVLDVGLPGLRGDRAVKAVRQHAAPSRVAVILYSGEGEEELLDLARRSGADAAVGKASSPRALIGEVERAVQTGLARALQHAGGM